MARVRTASLSRKFSSPSGSRNDSSPTRRSLPVGSTASDATAGTDGHASSGSKSSESRERENVSSPVRTAAMSPMLFGSAYDQVKKHLTDLGIKDSLAQWDLRVQVANPMEADEPSLLGMAVYVAIVSALRGQPIEMGTVVSGEMSVQGNLEGIDSVGEVIMIAREYGAVRIALPSLCELEVSNVPGELTKNIEIVYYDQPSDLVDRVLTKLATSLGDGPREDLPSRKQFDTG